MGLEKITPKQRKYLIEYLKQFYKYYPDEKYSIFNFVRYYKLRLKQDKDTWMAVIGETGGGKSLFVIMSQILFGKPFSLTRNVSYIPKGDEIVKKFKELNNETFLIDEAAKELRSVDWQKGSQKQVTTTTMTDRFRNNWVFLNMPNFNEFTKSLRDGGIHFRAVLLYRTKKYARIIIQGKSPNFRDSDIWFDKQAEGYYKKAMKSKKILTNEDRLHIERKMSNYLMDFIVPNLELILPEFIAKYKELKEKSRDESVELEQVAKKSKDIYKNKYKELLSRVTKILKNNELEFGTKNPTVVEMAEALGIQRETFRKHFNLPRNYEPLKVIGEKPKEKPNPEKFYYNTHK